MQGVPSNYKTIKCKYYEVGGVCKNGAACTYSHGEDKV
jgi:hypothetical protein